MMTKGPKMTTSTKKPKPKAVKKRTWNEELDRAQAYDDRRGTSYFEPTWNAFLEYAFGRLADKAAAKPRKQVFLVKSSTVESMIVKAAEAREPDNPLRATLRRLRNL